MDEENSYDEYEKDENGYVKIYCVPRPSKRKIKIVGSSSTSTSSDLKELAGVDDEFMKIIDEKKVTKDFLLNYELTDILRAAQYNDYLKERVETILFCRPLPILTFMKGTDTKIKLFPHQIAALKFMREKENTDPRNSYGIKGGIIRLEMGLGKTLTAIAHSLISPRKPSCEKHGENGFPTLIIASKTIITEWKKNGFGNFFDPRKVKVLYLHKKYLGDGIHNIDREMIVKFDFVITTYDVCSTACKKGKYHEDIIVLGDEHTLMKGKILKIDSRLRSQSDKPNAKGLNVIYTTPWERVFLDESQRISNPSTWTYKYIMAIYGKYKWCLTGTPVRNYETDIWAQFRFCGYNGVDRQIDWSRNYKYFLEKHSLGKYIFNVDYQDTHIKLPDKFDNTRTIELTGIEKMCYTQVEQQTIILFDKVLNGLCDFACILALFTRLRQCCIAPYLMTAESKREKGNKAKINQEKSAIRYILDFLENENNMSEWVHDKDGKAGIYSAKISEIINVLGNIPKNEKILVFSNFTSVLDLLAYACKKRLPHFKFDQMDGDTKVGQREQILQDFNNPNGNQGLFMTYKVGSEGLNLVEANNVICIEPWWTPCVQKQAITRCYRTGQEKNVNVFNIYIKDSIEERVLKICEIKEDLSNEIMGSNSSKEIAKLDKVTLGKILGIYD
jgi:SNF2 family DNA or RNA helicase